MFYPESTESRVNLSRHNSFVMSVVEAKRAYNDAETISVFDYTQMQFSIEKEKFANTDCTNVTFVEHNPQWLLKTTNFI